MTTPPRTDALREAIRDILLNYSIAMTIDRLTDRILAAVAQERDEALAKQPINTHRRLFDLVRNCRAKLHVEDLITDDEYAWLCTYEFKEDKGKQGSPSPRRLEDYDTLRTQLAAAEALNGRLREIMTKELPVIDRDVRIYKSHQRSYYSDEMVAQRVKDLEEYHAALALTAVVARGKEGK